MSTRDGLRLATALAAGTLLAAEAGAQQLEIRAFGGATFEADLAGDVSGSYLGTLYEGDFAYDLDAGWITGAAAGVGLGDFTLEGEIALRSNAADSFSFDLGSAPYEVDTSGDETLIVSYMANGWYHIPIADGFSGYGGGGVGFAQNVSDEDEDYEDDDESYGFAWQLGLGVTYQLTEMVSLGAGYRYFEVDGLLDQSESLPGGQVRLEGDYSDSAIIAEVGLTFF